KLGAETWFNLGDKDFATHVIRTELLRKGSVLSEVTTRFTAQLGIKATILPMTDDVVETRVVTAQGEMSFQEYFVKHGWQPAVKKVFYAGIENSRPAPGVLEAIRDAKQIIICPSNPITSIGPILAVPGIKDAIMQARASVIGVSPIIGDAAISGPAHILMRAQDWEPSAIGVANAYRDLLDKLLIDSADEKLRDRIRELGIQVA